MSYTFLLAICAVLVIGANASPCSSLHGKNNMLCRNRRDVKFFDQIFASHDKASGVVDSMPKPSQGMPDPAKEAGSMAAGIPHAAQKAPAMAAEEASATAADGAKAAGIPMPDGFKKLTEMFKP